MADPISDKIDPARPVTPLEGYDLPSANIRRLEDFINLVRAFMRDYPELNRLIAGEESTSRQIAWAIIDCLDDFNTTPPFTRFGLLDFPSRSLLLRGTVCTLLESIGLLQTRNHLQFSDGGITVGINDKTPFLQSWIQLFRAKYEDGKLKLKVAWNIESAWGGGIHSEFRFINNFYGEW
jgi:hypothetical protein